MCINFHKGSDIYFMRLDSAGVVIALKTFGGTGDDFGNALAIDLDNDILTSARDGIDRPGGVGAANIRRDVLYSVSLQQKARWIDIGHVRPSRPDEICAGV